MGWKREQIAAAVLAPHVGAAEDARSIRTARRIYSATLTKDATKFQGIRRKETAPSFQFWSCCSSSRHSSARSTAASIVSLRRRRNQSRKRNSASSPERCWPAPASSLKANSSRSTSRRGCERGGYRPRGQRQHRTSSRRLGTVRDSGLRGDGDYSACLCEHGSVHAG